MMTEVQHFNQEASRKIDILKGILIFLTVLGHSAFQNRGFHDIIFWFHMPLFFALSGAVFKGNVEIKEYTINKVKRLMPTYISWFIVISFFEGNICSTDSWIKFIRGGRACPGVYWYITVLLLTTIVFAILEKKIQSGTLLKIVLFCCLCAGSLESFFLHRTSISENQPLFRFVIWDADVILAAIFFYGMGFLYKDLIHQGIPEKYTNKKRVRKVILIIVMIIFITLSVLKLKGIISYQIDMKYVKYSDVLFNLFLPGLASIVLMELCNLLYERRISNILIYIGKASLVIMYSHLFILRSLEKIILPFTGRSIVVTIITVSLCYVLFRIFNRFRITKTLFISGLK